MSADADHRLSRRCAAPRRSCPVGSGALTHPEARYEIADPHLTDALAALVDTVLAVDDGAGCADVACDTPFCEGDAVTDLAAPGRSRTSVLQTRIRVVVTITIAYNVIEAVIAPERGDLASSAALIGFGLASVVEVLSAAAGAWQLAAPDPERRERVALRVIAFAFFALAAYVTVDAVLSFAGLREPEHSPVKIILAMVSLIIMPFLSWFERRTGRELGSASAVADSKQTLLCTYLSAALLVGLLLNSAFGWAWADSVAAVVIAAFAIREGIEAWRGDTCAVPLAELTGEGAQGN